MDYVPKQSSLRQQCLSGKQNMNLLHSLAQYSCHMIWLCCTYLVLADHWFFRMKLKHQDNQQLLKKLKREKAPLISLDQPTTLLESEQGKKMDFKCTCLLEG